MKIGFPAAGIDLKDRSYLSRDFVESGLIGVFDTENKSINVVSKNEIGSLLQWVKVNEIETIITPELKAMALRVFMEHNISVYKAEGRLLAMNIELLRSNCLQSFSMWDLNMQGASCSSSACSSCSSSCS